jgi:hypothetical protein
MRSTRIAVILAIGVWLGVSNTFLVHAGESGAALRSAESPAGIDKGDRSLRKGARG